MWGCRLGTAFALSRSTEDGLSLSSKLPLLGSHSLSLSFIPTLPSPGPLGGGCLSWTGTLQDAGRGSRCLWDIHMESSRSRQQSCGVGLEGPEGGRLDVGAAPGVGSLLNAVPRAAIRQRKAEAALKGVQVSQGESKRTPLKELACGVNEENQCAVRGQRGTHACGAPRSSHVYLSPKQRMTRSPGGQLERGSRTGRVHPAPHVSQQPGWPLSWAQRPPFTNRISAPTAAIPLGEERWRQQSDGKNSGWGGKLCGVILYTLLWMLHLSK